LDAGAWQDCNERDLISEELGLMEEGIFVNEDGDRLRGVTFFNVPIGEPAYVEAVLRNKAHEIARVASAYMDDMKEEYPQELWTVMKYSPTMRRYWRLLMRLRA
jgi:hypothetical protein